MTTLVTGPTGFVGSKVCSGLLARERDIRVTARTRSLAHLLPSLRNHFYTLENIGANTDWSEAISGINSIIHCAAQAHVMNENKVDALAAYRAVNREGTKNLAEQAAASGVKRFIFLSSTKVNGEQTIKGSSFTAEDNALPEDAYGISKWEAEQALHEVSARTGMEVIIIRPPLVYGPEVKGNFLSLLDWLYKGIPLPLGASKNQRSLVGIDNLVDLIITCVDHPAAANQTFLVSDDEDMSTTQLLRSISKALGKPAHLIPVPSSLLQFAIKLLGKQNVAQRLLGNLQVDISHTKKVLDWTPPVSVEEGLRRTAEWYLNRF